ncbi:MAG: pseudouridine synthase [Eubacteriales bacterium]|nr:pseudouridine synthase [Eubacteriales bacterium]
MRLNKYIAQSGIASRRKADELTLQGKVSVNGTVMKEPGYDIVKGDVVEVNGQIVKPDSRKAYIMLNKPKGFITSVNDERNRPTVMELVSDVDERLYPIGRLDFNTSGMLLMTNDGDLAYKLAHPRNQIYKTYRARVSGQISAEKQSKLRNGVDIGGFVTSKAIVDVIKQTERSAIVEIKIFEGKNRQVRKMFAVVGNKVLDLERIAIGELYLGHLKQGHYRKLTQKEIQYLKEC